MRVDAPAWSSSPRFIDIVLHLDRHLQWLVANYGTWIYSSCFLIIFCETGLVVTPFLPGDSLLFVAGAVAAGGGMHVHALFAVLAIASFSGDNTNYWIGRFVGPRIFRREGSLLFNPAHLVRTQQFYDEVRRQDGPHRPLRSDRAHFRSVRRGHGTA